MKYNSSFWPDFYQLTAPYQQSLFILKVIIITVLLIQSTVQSQVESIILAGLDLHRQDSTVALFQNKVNLTLLLVVEVV